MTTNEQPQYVTESFQRARKKLTPEVAGLSIVETYTMVWLCLDKLADFRSPEWMAKWARRQVDILERGRVH
jgi:hypothetical protein